MQDPVIYVLKDAIIEQKSGHDFDDEVSYMIAAQESAVSSPASPGRAFNEITLSYAGLYFSASSSIQIFPSVAAWRLGYFPLQVSVYLKGFLDCVLSTDDIELNLSVDDLKEVFNGNDSAVWRSLLSQSNDSCVANARQACGTSPIFLAVPENLPASYPFLEAISNVLGASTDEVLSRATIADGIASLPYKLLSSSCVLGFHLPIDVKGLLPVRYV